MFVVEIAFYFFRLYTRDFFCNCLEDEYASFFLLMLLRVSVQIRPPDRKHLHRKHLDRNHLPGKHLLMK